MGLFGSLFTGVSALGAQSQNTAVISNNIANISTNGFKRSEASFFSLVTTEGRSSRFSPGTVSVNRLQHVNQQGGIQQTASATDASISGNGFFPVKRSTDSTQEFLYTRAGTFSEDSQGLLRNASGFVLYALPIDANGNLPANQGDLSALIPADVAFLGGLTRPTSEVEQAINLDADTIDESLVNALTSAADFSRGVNVFDSLGSAQTLTFEYTKVYGPQGTASSIIGSNTAATTLVNGLGLSDGDQFSIAVDGGVPRTYEINTIAGALANIPAVADAAVETVGDIINDINANLAGASAFLGNDGELVIQRDDYTGGAAQDIAIADITGTPLTGLGLTAGTFASDDLSGAGVYDNGLPADSPPYSSEGFPAPQNLPGDLFYNPRGWWQLKIIDPNNNTLTTGLLNFNGDGGMNALNDSNGNIDIELNNVNFGNGSELQDINIDIQRYSQFAGNFDVIFTDQNGAELGLRTGVELTREGKIVARFSNGASTELYQIPLITFSNPNGLTEVSGTAYTESDESGEENLRLAGTGGAGFIEPSTLEASNVDLADEFARLIVAQRAFGAGTRVITTVDQMTNELLNLR